MAENVEHVKLVKELSEQLKPVFENSNQGIYLYLDDAHKACNKKFAEMLGYNSPEEWAKNEYPISDVIDEDQEKGIHAYIHASQKFHASSIDGTWKKKNGETVKTEVIFVPITFKDEVFVLHFITPKT